MTPTDRRHARQVRKRARVALEHARNKRPDALTAIRQDVAILRADGVDDDEIARTVAVWVDDLLPLGIFGPVGMVAEVLDGPIAYAIARLILASVKKDPKPLPCGCTGGMDCERCKFP